ncbi:MAG TPA: DNA polymerase [Acidimicrobiales bacterium]|nr:DNA polymerase [Acidimicrobiales bacterium]
MSDTRVLDALLESGVARGELVALALDPGIGLAVATATRSWAVASADPCGAVALVERGIGPRWVLWSNDTAVTLARAGVRVARAFDLACAHRILEGTWAADPARVWAAANGLDADTLPSVAPPDLFSSGDDDDDADEPVRRDGHLRPEWAGGAWRASPERLRRWSALAQHAAAAQIAALGAIADRPAALATARAESAVELLCAEMTVDGLPMDRVVAEGIVAGFVGPRPRDEAAAAEERARRDAAVLRHATPGFEVDLRSSTQVRAMLRRLGIDVVDTRAARLRELEDTHPIVRELLAWRRAERVATTYGYAWLDEHLGADGRFRGSWSGSDGAAGRMTASGGLHNMPAEFRPAVVAEPGHVFVRADLGQVEPRVLAAVSHDAVLARATLQGDLYAAVAAELGVDRATAKVAVLGAMYGQTTGHGADALRRMRRAYPVAMDYLDRAEHAAAAGRDLRTYGGRLVRFGPPPPRDDGTPEPRASVAARGRYGRNAVVQGAAAELFKRWAVTLRARGADLGAQIVLCLHDELLVHTPLEQAAPVASLLDSCLQDAAERWSPGTPTRFVADVSVVARWSDAKDASAPPDRRPATGAP